VDKKVVGPAFKDVAKKYKGDAAAVEKLTTAMHKGSQGKWGQIPMPPTANLKDEDAKALAGWIMSL
jgi:cytochrome c